MSQPDDTMVGELSRSDKIPKDEIHFKCPLTGRLLGKIVNVGTDQEETIDYGHAPGGEGFQEEIPDEKVEECAEDGRQSETSSPSGD